jgi:hypothetical protein
LGTLTADRLRAVVSYDPETGIFRRLTGPRQGKAIAGIDISTGYVRFWVDGGMYRANRLAWLYMTGQWPTEQIDHRNTVRADNRWANLREASRSQNKTNCHAYANNTSGIKGVSPSGRANKPWAAAISKDGVTRRIGRFVTKAEAARAYAEAASRLHGEFARVGV